MDRRWMIVKRTFDLNLVFDSYEELYQKLSTSFLGEVSFLVESLHLKPYVALSGGYDSRLILAVVSHVVSAVRTYTHVFPGMKPGDFKIPKAIAPKNNFLRPGKYSPKLETIFDQHSGKHAVDADRYFFSHQQWQSFREEDVCIRGGVLEFAGKSPAHLYERLPELNYEDKENARVFNYALSDFRDFQIAATEKYFEYGKHHPLKAEFHKRYYLDQRIAGWLSYIEQSLTLTKPVSYNLGNSIYQYNLMKSIPSNMMSVKGFHVDFI